MNIKIIIAFLLGGSLFLSTPAMKTKPKETQQERVYTIGNDIGFRWSTTLNVRCEEINIDSETEHYRLNSLVTNCSQAFKSKNANVAAASLQVIFKDGKQGFAPIQAIVYHQGRLGDISTTARADCFSTACLEVSPTSHPPITYDNRETLDASIDFIFSAIEMKTERITEPKGHLKYNYRDTEFQVVHELFSPKSGKYIHSSHHYQEQSRTPRFYEIFLSMLTASNKKLDDVVLIILHIHTQYDPCAVCAEMLCKLSKTLNYKPEALLQSKDEPIKKLCTMLEAHDIKFLIEVSSDDRYWNSRDAGLSKLYLKQLLDVDGLGKQPIKIPAKEEFSKKTFPPLVIFKQMNLPFIFEQ